MNDQTAMRQGNWKLVLNGQLVKGAPPEDDVHLAVDMGKRNNLKDEFPEITAELRAVAEAWRTDIEKQWRN